MTRKYKPKSQRPKKSIPGLINVGRILARTDHGSFMYVPNKGDEKKWDYQDIWMSAHLRKNSVGFNFILRHSGLNFTFCIDDPKEVKAFVEWVNRAYKECRY